MFAFRVRILEVGRESYLGIVEGFPQILVHEASQSECEATLARTLIAFLEGLQDPESTRIQLDDFPTVRGATLILGPKAT